MAPRPPKPDPATPRTFTMRDRLVDETGEPIVHISIGCAPQLSLTAGQSFTTTDPRLAGWLAKVDELEETTK